MSDFNRSRDAIREGESGSEDAERIKNPRRRLFSQFFEDCDGEIIDLYGAERRSMVVKTPPATPPPISSSQEAMMEAGRAKPWLRQETMSPRNCITIEPTRNGSVRSKILKSNLSATSVSTTPVERPEPPAMKERRRRHGWDDSTFLDRLGKRLAIIAGVFVVLTGLLLIFFWPRSVRIAVKQVTRVGEENYQLATTNGLIEVSLLHNLETLLENPNFAGIRVKSAVVQGQWVMRHGNRPFFGNGTMEDKVSVPARSSRTIKIPYSIYFAGDPASDSLYLDFLTRCTDKDKTQRMVQIEYQVKAKLSYLGMPFTRKLNYSYRVPRPLTPSQIGEIVKTSGVSLQDISLAEVGKNLKEIIEANEAREKAEDQTDAKAEKAQPDGKAEKMVGNKVNSTPEPHVGMEKMVEHKVDKVMASEPANPHVMMVKNSAKDKVDSGPENPVVNLDPGKPNYAGLEKSGHESGN